MHSFTKRWYRDLDSLVSRGSQTVVQGGLAGLAAARASHEGQFWTPSEVAWLMWRLLGLDVFRGGRLSILDNSFGSGRLFQFADPDLHTLHGIEKDPACFEAVSLAVRKAGFHRSDLVLGSMEEFRADARSYDVAVINPPFSVHLDSPAVEPFLSNSYGRYGQRSSAMSHFYALEQALAWCNYVAALLPRSCALEVQECQRLSSRLRSIYHLPATIFAGEGASVETSICLFGDRPRSTSPHIEHLGRDLQPGNPGVDFARHQFRCDDGRLRSFRESESDGPAVTLPVTHDRRVKISHSGRRLVLGFRCAIAQARVLNWVYQDLMPTYRSRKDGRIPKGVRYTGEGKLDLECYLAQPNAMASFRAFVQGIADLGFTPRVDPAIERLLRKRMARLEIRQTPYRHVAREADGGLGRWLEDQQSVHVSVRKSYPVWESGNSPKIPDGACFSMSRSGDGWAYTWSSPSGTRYGGHMSTAQALDRLSFADFVPHTDEWRIIHAGLADAFPARFAEVEKRARRLGLDRWCTWSYQFHDLCEVTLKKGGIVGWDVGLGKSQSLDSKILTPSGWKRMGDIAAGDKVIGSSGKPISVLATVPQGDRPIFRVTFTDGSSTECDEEHLWHVSSFKARYHGCRPRAMTLRQIMDSGLCAKHAHTSHKFYIPIVGAVEFDGSQTERPIDPYLLGLLLGNGGLSRPGISITTPDQEVVDAVARSLPDGMIIRHRSRFDYYIQNCRRGMRSPLIGQLRSIGLHGCRSHEKFVPDCYKIASVDVRLSILQGLLDTDGYASKSGRTVQFTSVSERLADDVLFLVQSLGGVARKSSRIPTYTCKDEKKQGRRAYTLTINLPDGIKPFRLARKADRCDFRRKYQPSRAIKSVEYVGVKPAQCLVVDAPDQLYVTDDFIVTHNCRLALALCLLGGRRNLIVVEANLVDEMVREIGVLGLDRSLWQVIEKPEHLDRLRRVNIIAYSRLKLPVRARSSKRMTYARRLRRCISTLVADECHLLRNPDTDQSRAVWMVSPKRRFGLSGTPIANYPRDILPLLQWSGGDGTAEQPYGLHHPMLVPGNINTLADANRGVDVFRDYFVTVEWITNEFADDLRSGAKREIPRIRNVAAFRDLVAPWIKRRVSDEPEVAAHIQIPRPTHRVITLAWDDEHLRRYVQVARTFVNWFRGLNEWRRHSVGLIAILAKLQAVSIACNEPQQEAAGIPGLTSLSSKQRYALARLEELAASGRKTIFLANSPATIDRMAAELTRRGVENVSFHGGVTVARRNALLDDAFRFGSCPLLLASKGVLQTGYNIHQASRVMFYDRSWTPKVEYQAAGRVLRPQQKSDVEIEYLHLDGSIDIYQAQMVNFKQESMRAGLDYGADETDRDFLHIETILGRFVEDFQDRFSVNLEEPK